MSTLCIFMIKSYNNVYFLLIASLHIAILKYNLFANGIEHIDAYAWVKFVILRIKFVILQFIYIWILPLETLIFFSF